MLKHIIHSLFTCVIFSPLLFLPYGCATTPDTEKTNKAEAHYKIGVSYREKGQLNEAFIEFQKAIKLNPEHKDSLNELGYISTRFKKYDDAISYYKHAISIDPAYSEAMNNLGLTYREIGDLDEAIRYFKMALNNPIYATPEKAYSNMAFAYYKKGDYTNAEDAVREALIRNPDFPFAIYINGLLNTKSGDDETAIEDFKKVLNIMPDNIEVHWEIAHVYLKTGKKDTALKHFKIIAEKGDDPKIVNEALEYIELLKRRN